jgi:hypothetical protein
MPKPIPYNFVFDHLTTGIVTKQHFGMYYIYFNKKIMLILRKAAKNAGMNGIWVAAAKEHHTDLQNDMPPLSGFMLDDGETHDSGWRLIKDNDDNFEEAAIKVCELINRGDKRIGKATEGGALL